MITVLSILYGLCALVLTFYTIGHGLLLIQYLRHRKDRIKIPQIERDVLPHITIQLPIYNEKQVVLRLVEAVVALDYPAEKLHIQILDDSDDDTTCYIERQAQRYSHMNITHLRRSEREGYKAGALAYGLERTASPYIAIFDADFVPPPDFLQQTLPHLIADPSLALVQTRWGHLNPDMNGLTQAQVLSIDTHFLIEQNARSISGWPLPFNGTGGIWRRSAIVDAGGWSAATLTEDLDLSFRAQIRGWRALFLPEIVVPGEIPPQLAAYRQQQARWAQGSAQCLRRLIVPVWRSDLPVVSKLIATQHLFQYVPHLMMWIMLLLTPLLLMNGEFPALPLAPLGFVGLIPPLMYAVSQYDNQERWGGRLLAFPILLLIGTGMIWSNTRALLVGLTQSHGEFRRTPKFQYGWYQQDYALKLNPIVIGEVMMLVYALWGVLLAWQHEKALMPYILIHAASFATVLLLDTRDQWRILRAPVSHPRPLTESGYD